MSTAEAASSAEPAANEPERGRPQTLGAATTTDQLAPVRAKSGGGLGLAMGLLVLLGAGVVGAVMVLSKSGTDADGTATAAPEAAAAVLAAPSPPEQAPPVDSAEPKPAVAPAASTAQAEPNVQPVSEPSTVKVTVQTEPPGAVLEKDGFQVCDKTPCEIELRPGEGVQFDAVLGNRRGSAKVLAQNDQSVTIPLKAPVVKKPPPKKMCEVNVGGLKILRECPE